MAAKDSLDPSSRDSSPDFAAMAATSRRRSVTIAVIGLAVLGGGIGFGVYSAHSSADQERAAAAAALRGCLLQGPLEAKESVVVRFRRLQLGVQEVPDAEVDQKRSELWPMSCGDELAAMKDLFNAANNEEATQAMEALGKVVSSSTAHTDKPNKDLVSGLKTLDKHVPGELPALAKPLSKPVLNVDSLKEIPPISKQGTAMSRAETEDNPGISLPVLLTEDDLDSPVLCTFKDSAAASCRDLQQLKKVKGQGLRLLGTSDESSKSLIFAGHRGAEGVFVAGEQAPLASVYSYGGYASGDGNAAVLGWNEDSRKMVLVRRAPGKQPETTTLNPNFRVGNYFYSAQLLWDQVLVRGVTPKNERRLFTLPLGESSGGDFSLVDVGELAEPGLIRHGEEDQPHITGCRTRDATIVRVRGRDNDFITFRIGDKFTMPVFGPTWGVLGCYGSTATLTTAAYSPSGTKLYHSVCTSAGCKSHAMKSSAVDGSVLAHRPTDARDVQAVDLAGKLLLIWRAGERGGLRMRMAAPERFEKTPSQVLFDDLVSDGDVTDISTILGFRVYSRERFAVLLLSTVAGLHAFRISPDGKVAPFEVARSAP